MSTEGSGETPSAVPSLPGAPEQTYLFPKAKGHSRSISHGGTPMLAGAPPRPLKSALRGHQRALSHGQIAEGAAGPAGGAAAGGGGGHARAASRTDFILPPGHREPGPGAGGRATSMRAHHSRQASRSDSIYTLRRESSAGPWQRTLLWLMRKRARSADNRHIIIIPNHLVPDKTPPEDHPNRDRTSNHIRTNKYTLLSFLPKNLFEQFHRVANVYFIFIVLLNWVPALNAFGKEIAMLPVLFVLAVTAFKDLFEDLRRQASDNRINNLYCRVFKKSTENYVRVKWSEVRAGDIVHLSNNEHVPADMVLLHSSHPSGLCFLDTCNLDGETNLKQRVVAAGFKNLDFKPLKFMSTVEVERPSTKIYRFNGCLSHPNGARVPISSDNVLLRDCRVKNTDFVEGIVVYAGHETKAMLNNGGPRYKCSKLERRMNKDVVWTIMVLLFLCCTGAVGCKMWLDTYYSQNSYHGVPFLADVYSPGYEGLLKFWTYIIVLQVMIPVSLYVTIEVTKLFQVYYINQDVQLYDPDTDSRAECRALNVTEELGQISYFFTDKTGTLTENKMLFRRCTVNGVDYNHPPGKPAVPSPELPPIVTPTTQVSPNPRLLQILTDEGKHTKNVREFMLILAICNTVVVSRPHVDHMPMATSSEAMERPKSNVALRPEAVPSHDRYSRLAESRSTTPSPPPGSGSPLSRLRMPRFTKSEHARSSDRDAKAETVVSRFEAESPDELALAEAALAYGYELRVRHPDSVELGVRGVLTTIQVLGVQEFDATRKCMSIAVLIDDQVVVYVKGADSTVLGALAPMHVSTPEAIAFERTRALLSDYSRAGLRTLVMAKRTMTRAEWDEWEHSHSMAQDIGEGRDKRIRDSLARLESELTLIGATGVEDRLQDNVPHTIRALLDAGIVVWVLTGDKPETAVNIAYSAALFSQSDQLLYLMSRDKDHAESTIKGYLQGSMVGFRGRALVVDGRTITYILDRRSGLVTPFLTLAKRCSSVLCCRATPLQKAYIVKAVKEELGVTTLAIGDGANDVSMIQTADIGIGLSGQEGRQAVMAADFTLSKFKYVARLLLVHGHWSYDRIARMVLYFFYKNALFVFIVFWSQLYCGFSTTVMVDQMHWMMYNLAFTSWPPLAIGIYDRVAPASLLMERPGLYSTSRRGLTYRTYSLWLNIGEALYASVVIFFTACITYWDTDVDLLVFGMANTTCCLVTVLCYVAVETRSWTLVHSVALLGSLLSYAVVTVFFHSVCVTCFVPSTLHVVYHAAADPSFWLLTVLTTVVALAPRMMLHAIRNSVRPATLRRAVMARRRYPRRMPFAAHYHTTTSSAHVYRATNEDGSQKSNIAMTDVPEIT